MIHLHRKLVHFKKEDKQKVTSRSNKLRIKYGKKERERERERENISYLHLSSILFCQHFDVVPVH